jgi:hypothetical protein
MLRVVVNHSKALVAFHEYQNGNVIRKLIGKVQDTPTRTSIKIQENQHIEDDFGAYINHSCTPNTAILHGHLIALKHIPLGEEITFDYLKNEDALAAPFVCNKCHHEINGTVGCQKNR